MASDGFSPKRLTRVRAFLEGHVESGFVPGMVVVLARRGEVHVEATGTLAFEGAGSSTPMAADTICRLASTTKPIVAACAMTLVQDGLLSLDGPVDDLLPELADMTVLIDPEGPLEATVAAKRPITLRDLLTFTLGTGMIPAPPGTVPIADALDALGEPPLDEWLRRLGALPLVHQPGESWLYDIGADVTGALIARATGRSFGEILRERIFEPLGMADTGFSVPAENLDRLATVYGSSRGERVVEDGPDERWSWPPTMESGSGGLVSSAADVLKFASVLLAGGAHRRGRLLSQESLTLMTTDQLTPHQKVACGFGPEYFDAMGWGFGMSVITRRTNGGLSAGSYGWPGMYGTAWYNDPSEDLAVVVMMQRSHAGNQQLPMWQDFWAAVYEAID